MEITEEQQNSLINKLIPEVEKQFAAPVSRIETHISIILLVADKAFKIKKPVDFGFLDFSTLEKRRFYCQEELRLNSRLAPGLYQKVLTINGSIDGPVLNGPGNPIEYMIQMQRFEQQHQLDNLLNENKLEQAHIDSLADIIADFHQSIPKADINAEYVQPETIKFAVQQNFDQIRPLQQQLDSKTSQQLNALEQWSTEYFERLKTVFTQRLQKGFVRECHGDMHLGNITLFEDEITIFDGIEFNNAFRWIDVISELAFLLMDLQHHEKPEYASRLLNRYLEVSGDYEGLQLLPFYQVYRAMVRAKVTALRLSQLAADNAEHNDLMESFIQHISLARKLSQQQCRFLMITHGVSGSGKSYASQQVIEHFNAIRIRSDVERIRMFTDTRDRYSSKATEKTYARILALGTHLIQSGYSVVLDATYLQTGYREAVQTFANQLDCPFIILDMQCETEEMERRIRQRLANDTDQSEATIEVLHKQLESQELLSDEEKNNAVVITPSSNVIEAVAAHIHQ